MNPFVNCPACNVRMKWILHDGSNSYACPRSYDGCPINFHERVWYPEDAPSFELDGGHGLLERYFVTLDGYQMIVDYGYDSYHNGYKTPKILLSTNGLPKGKLISVSSSKHPPIVIPLEKPIEIDLSDLTRLKEKIRAWIIFS